VSAAPPRIHNEGSAIPVVTSVMKSHVLRLGLIPSLVAIAFSAPSTQMRVAPLDLEQGHVALGLALRHLSNTGVFMHATAHPDDENNGLLVMLNRGLGYRTALATATRGNGGQNEIGPEIFEALGVLRTEELAALHRFDGAEQYFTRAVDFGYSFSLEETFEQWGREEILGDFVHLIRMIRPDVILSLPADGDGGGQHHQASAVLAREAFALAGDPTKFPEQVEDGLRPWQPRKFYVPADRFGGPPEAGDGERLVPVDLATYDPLLGRTYAEIGTEARSMHKCQGMAQLLALPAPVVSRFRLVESAIPGQLDRVEQSLFDGVDTTFAGLARFAGARPPRDLTQGLSAIASAVARAQRAFDTGSDQETLIPLLTGLRAVRALRGRLRALALDDEARFEIDFRLRQKEREFQQAIVLANGIRVEALADDGVVVPGQPLELSVIVANRGAADVTVGSVTIDGFDGTPACTLTSVLGGGGFGGPGSGGRGRGRGRGASPEGPPLSVVRKDQVGRCTPTVTVPGNARVSEPYWHREGEAGRYTFDDDAPFGLPYRPTPFYVQLALGFGDGPEVVFHGAPVQHRYEGSIFSGEKRAELLVVPAFSVRVAPEVAIVPSVPPARPVSRGTPPAAQRPAQGGRGAGRGATPPPARPAPPPQTPESTREIRVTVVNATPAGAESTVRLTLPDGWTSTPAEHAVEFSREDESRTVRFHVRPPERAAEGEHQLTAVADAAGRSYDRGYQVIEYPHISRRHIFHPATARLKVLDVRIAPNLAIGYVMGVGDDVPAAIAQLGARVEMIGADDLAWGDLARFSAIVTGVRAYERRADLRANNSRLLEYVRDGGTLIVQYNKFEFNEAQYGPYPAEVSSDRVTAEHAPVTVLAPDDPVFTTPNRITDAVWQGWVQERGLYFLGDKDSRYQDLVELVDPFPSNPGPQRGALVAASYGKGRWVYVGLGLWRELPAGVDGAYQLLANLISLR
jgi:LmbE family N-acetylglucosaminyl deacetylase